MKYKKIMLLGSGELGREVTISAKRLGLEVIAVDNYLNAPAMQMADHFEVIDMLNEHELERVIKYHLPDLIVPEVESIRTSKLIELEKEGFNIIPTAKATFLTMDRVAIRELAANKLKLRTAKFEFANNEKELIIKSEVIGFPCVIKPVMSSSGKGQSTAKSIEDLKKSWTYACEGMRGDQQQVIIEEFINFDYEITLLTIRQRTGETLFVEPIGHRQESGDYRESWMPAKMSKPFLNKAKDMAQVMTNELGGAGLFGVEFFVTKDEVIFSELSPRPHDTGMVTLIGQDLSEFDLHIRAITGLPIPKINLHSKASASAVILADRESTKFHYEGIESALELADTEIRIFNKPTTRLNRRMGIALSRAETIEEAINLAKKAALRVKLVYDE